MEAAGLQDIRSCPTDDLYFARLKSGSLLKRWNFPPTRPFVLVGVKP
jgi:hypothetical protein